MEQLIIGYDFRFTLVVKKRNGKIFHRHIIAGLGINFSSALWDVYFRLKKCKTQILKITAAEPIRIAFAFRGEESLKLHLADFPPAIPASLEDALKYLPN